jgi:hypothetical protein
MRPYDAECLSQDSWGLGVVPAMDHCAGGRKSHYDPRIGREIIDAVLNGKTIRQITAEADMPSYATVFHWTKVHPDFAWRYQGARAHMAWERAEKIKRLEALRRRRSREAADREGRKIPRGWARSTFDEKKAKAFCRRVAAGQTLTRICARPDMPSMKVVYRWLRQFPRFRTMYLEARERHLLRLKLRAEFAADDVFSVTTRREFTRMKRKVAKLDARVGRRVGKVWRQGALDCPLQCEPRCEACVQDR